MPRSPSPTFSDLVTCFVINLDSRPDRWRRVERMCRGRGIEPVRFSAHDGVIGQNEFPYSPLSPGELGLWSSFKTVVTAHVETEWILVLEDDAILLPGFRRQVLKELRRIDPEIISIRMGWLGPFAWRNQSTVTRYFAKLPRRILGHVGHRVRKKLSRGGAVRPRSLWGTHALLVRRAGFDDMFAALGEASAPLDNAFAFAEMSEAHRFIRSKRNRAWQWPDASDIRAGRRAHRRLT